MRRVAGRELNPTFFDRMSRICAPGWIRSVFVRRAVAVALIGCAALITVTHHQRGPTSTALVAAGDLRPGQPITAADIRQISVPEQLTPADPVSERDALGRRVTGAVQAGEIIARHRLLDSRLPAALTGRADARLVPVRPADNTITAFVRAGDLVDLLAEDARVLARGAVVALTPAADDPAPTQRSADTGTVLMAMGEADAHRVAAAGLRDPLTLVLH